MKSKFLLGLFVVFFFLFVFILTKVQIKPDGDIVEYYGVTETVLNHGSLDLRAGDIAKLEEYIDPPKFNNPGYYINGLNHKRYPVHFWAYSLFLLPVRLGLELFRINPLLSFPLTNLFLLFGTLLFVLKRFLKKPLVQALFLALVFTSPLVFYLTWPGPDMAFLCLLLVAVFYFQEKKYWRAALLTALASWQSQPLIILVLFFLSMGLYYRQEGYIKKPLLILILAAIPYLYNFYAFGVLTPWTLLENAWSQVHSFGLQNISLRKTWEQFFDPNIGLFWYAPILVVGGIYLVKHFIRHRDWQKLSLFVAFLVTSFFYQTNPAWHYGTTGFGPSRHIVFFVPFLLVWLVWQRRHLKSQKLLVALLFMAALQLFSLSFNGWFNPNTTNSLVHSPYAQYLLSAHPKYYHPTPEIFIDRTLHQDVMGPTMAVYKVKGICRLAYVLKGDLALLEKHCGFIPESAQSAISSLDKLPAYEGVYVAY